MKAQPGAPHAQEFWIKKPKDKTIAGYSDNYRFTDYKEQATGLLQRV